MLAHPQQVAQARDTTGVEADGCAQRQLSAMSPDPKAKERSCPSAWRFFCRGSLIERETSKEFKIRELILLILPRARRSKTFNFDCSGLPQWQGSSTMSADQRGQKDRTNRGSA
jgi:hypothetical protein